MQIRYRWYRIQLPRGDIDLPSIFNVTSLTKSSYFGFSRIDDAFETSKFRFLWRTKVILTRYTDEGIPYYEEIANVNFTDFAIITVDDVIFLRVENPGRNMHELFNAMESLVGLGFTSKPLTFLNAIPTKIFESVDATKLIGLKVVGAVIDEDLVARMEFASKQGISIENMKLLDSLNYKVDSSIFELMYEGVRGQVAFTSSGLVKVSGQLAPRLVYLIENKLPILI